MKDKLVFRILGALASSLIIVSVFIPFVKHLGYTQSIWEAYKATDGLYLPIMIIVFGAIGVLVFLLNIKTEFAYSTSGAILFYLISESVSVIKMDMFSSLNVGYYCLAIGAVLTALMAFINNLKSKKVTELTQNTQDSENTISMLDQIDKLYNDQNLDMQIQNNDSLNNVIQPLPIVDNIQPLPPITQPSQNMEMQIQQPIQPVNLEQPISQPVVQPQITNMEPVMSPPVIQQVQTQALAPQPLASLNKDEPAENNNTGEIPVQNNIVDNNQVQQAMPAINNNVNPVVAEFEVSKQVETTPSILPEVQSTPMKQEQPIEVVAPLDDKPNPVVSEFTIPSNNKILGNSEPVVNTNVNTPVNNNSNLDIFN